MKSLKIVNDRLDYIEKHPEHKCCHISQKKLQQIKDDLEVLEIIKNKNVILKDLKFSIQGFIQGAFETMEVVLWSYNLIRKEEEQLTMEELLKLKQWLEVND